MSLQHVIGKPPARADQDSEHWMSVSDLMAGLMMVFLFISIAYMHYMLVEKDRIKEIAVTYQNNQVALYEALHGEFVDDLERWDAEIDKESLEFRFRSPDVLFAQGDIRLRSEFERILDDFFPRYLAVLGNFRSSIEEVRIEGHTSSIWNVRTDPETAYFHNMELSQGRTRAVLNYVHSILPAADGARDWVRRHVAAVGYSSSRLVLDEQGDEDDERSRRVSFRVMTNAETQIRKILED